MTWYPDLAPCNYFGDGVAHVLRAVGWLEAGRPVADGPTPRPVYDKLSELLMEPWMPCAFAGSHFCDLCKFQYDIGGPAGTANVFIPGDGILYVSPELITHYMNAHYYRPPPEFCEAVLRCPGMRSREYMVAMLANGGRELKSLWQARLPGREQP